MTNTSFTVAIGTVLAIGIGGLFFIQTEKVVEVDVPVVEISATTLQEDIVSMNNQASVGIQDPRDVGLDYPQKVNVIDQGADVGFALLGVDMETLDYIPLRMDVEGYIMCKDVNKAVFKLVPRDDVANKSPEELIELIREKKGE